MTVLKNVRRFLTPGWVLAIVVAIAFSYIAFTVLAPWQLGKNTRTQHRNEQIERAFDLDPVDVDEIMPKGEGFAEGSEWRRVTAQGEFLPNTQVLLRNRPVDGSPAIQVLDVFAANNGENYLVNRGFVRPNNAGIPDVEAAPSGTTTISAYTREDEIAPETSPVPGTPPQVYGINIEEISGLTGVALNPDWLQLSEDSDGVIEAIPLPALESGPYLSYGIQWIFFGIGIPLAVIWFIRAEIVEGRRDRAEQEEMAKNLSDAETAEPAHSSEPTESVASNTNSEAPQAPNDQPDAPEQRVPDSTDSTDNTDSDRAAELRRKRMAQRYGSTGHRASGHRDNRYDERF